MSRIKKYPTKPLQKGVAKVPVVVQLEMVECGAACLTMILEYYGKWVSLETIRNECGVSRDGANVKNILDTAIRYDLIPSPCKVEPEDLQKEGKFPCIIHWNFNHFVILDGFKGGKAYLNDPARGRYHVSMETFDKSFTGICLELTPNDHFKPSGKPKSVLPFIKEKLKGTGTAFTLMIVSTIISSVIGLINPGFARVFADRLLTRQNPEWFMPFIIGISLISAVQIIVSAINTIYSLKANGKIAIVSNSQYMWHVLRLPIEFYSQRSVGDITSRKTNNASISSSLITTFAPLFIQGFMMIFYLVVLLRHSAILSLFAIASVAINFWLATYTSKKLQDFARFGARDAAKLSAASVAAAEMIDSIKASGSEDGFFERWSGYQASMTQNQAESSKMELYWGLIPNIVSAFLSTCITAGSVLLCMRGDWTVGMITAFSVYVTSFTGPAMQFVSASQTIQSTRTNMERIDDVMNYPTDRDCVSSPTDSTAEYDKLSGKIELRNVTFGYSKLAPPLIENFSMTLEPGQRVAFVGPSGCGKSTISKLISGLYQPWSGEILFDGKPMQEIDHNVFTSSLSVVDQDITLFNDTISNNLKMWDDSIADFEITIAARDAQIHNDIVSREGGYDAVLSEGGKNLSGGQRQRLEIARVLAEDPRIIVLDEATSALDAKTEYGVVKSIQKRGLTCIMVAHRLSTIRDCDEIIVLNNGKVVERGTHKELYALGGTYTNLVGNE